MQHPTYEELKQFNITKLMKKEYLKKNSLAHLNDFLSEVNFAEHSEVSFVYFYEEDKKPRQQHMTRKESLGENIVDSLPFKAYENYVTYQWLKIDEDNNSRFIYHAFNNHAVELIDKLGDKGFEAYQNKDMNHYEFHRLYLENTLKFSSIFTRYHHQEHRAESFHNDFYPVFLKATSYYKFICEHENQHSIKVKNWLIDLPDVGYSLKDKKEQVIERFRSILSYPSATLFLDGAFEQLKFISKVPGIKDKSDFLLNNNFIELALEKGNTHFLNKLSEVSEKDIMHRYESLLSNILEKSNQNPNKAQLSELKNAIKSYPWFKNEKIERNLELLILSDRLETREDVKSNLDIYQKSFTLKHIDFTVHDALILNELSNDFQAEVLTKTLKSPLLFLQVGSALKEHGFRADFKNTSQSDIKEKFDITLELMVKSFRDNDRENITLPDIEQWFVQKYLDKKLECSSQSTSKIKI